MFLPAVRIWKEQGELKGDWTQVKKNFQKLSSLKLGDRATPTFAELTLTGLTASRLVSTDSAKKLTSVSDLTAWIAGTANQITVTDDADGTITLSTPQDIHTGASPQFAGLNLGNSGGSYRLSIFSTDGTDQLGIYHDNSTAQFRTTDGAFEFITDEGTNTNTYIDIKGKGTGVGVLRFFDQDDAEYCQVYCASGQGIFGVFGTNVVGFNIQSAANCPVRLFKDATEGQTQEFRIQGFRTGDISRSLQIGVGTDAADTASFDGLSNYKFVGDLLSDKLTLSKTCTLAAGLNVLRVTGLQTDGTAMTGTLRGAYIDVSNGSTAATGTIRGMELKARTEAPGDTGNDVTVLEGLSISADSKGHSVTTMRAAEFILDGSTGGTITKAVGLRIANNLQANKATTSYGIEIYRDSFDYTADINLTATPIIHADGLQIIKFDAVNCNVLLGAEAFNSDEGQRNLGVGYRTGYYNDTTGGGVNGTNNVYIGYKAGYGDSGGATGDLNIGIGFKALLDIDTGRKNLMIGSASGSAINSGSNNVGVGSSIFTLLTSGNNNIGIGSLSLDSVVSGSQNVAIGISALESITGNNNVGIGHQAGLLATGTGGVYIGYRSSFWNTGSPNTIIGYQAGMGVNGGSTYTDCVFIGYRAGFRQTTTNSLLIIDNQDRESVANEITTSLIYGVFAATAAAQSLRINGEILGSDGAKIGDASTNYTLFGTNGDLSFTGTAGFYPRFLTQADEPAAGTGATQCDTSELVIWKDSDDNKVYLCFNDSGTVKTVELA